MAQDLRFERPIPGESLTQPPRNAKWERAPEIVDPDEAIEMHLTRVNTPKRILAIIGLVEEGLDVKTITEGILRSAVSEGMHTIDVSLIVGPVLHEFICDTLEEANIDYDDGLTPEDETPEGRQLTVKRRARRLFQKSSQPPAASNSKRFIPVERGKKKRPAPDTKKEATSGDQLELDLGGAMKEVGLMSRKSK